MNVIDTHTHLYLPEFETDNGGVETVNRAFGAGVEHLIFPNVDFTTIEPMQVLASKFPGRISMAMGLHPTEVKDDWEEATGRMLEHFADGNRYVAVGEIGIDLYWDRTYEREQMLSLEMQVSKAEVLGLPVIIHCREGLAQVLEVLKGFPRVMGVFHSFGGTVADVEAIRRVGDYYFGINGIVTFKNCKVREVLPEITLDRLLLETDAPYLAPVPHRGKRNESAYIIHTAHHIAAHLGLPADIVADATTANARSLFGIPEKKRGAAPLRE